MTNNKEQKLSVLNPDAAGIDVGSREHYVCVPDDRDEKNVRKFAAFKGISNIYVKMWYKTVE
jgi:transposase